MLVKISLSLQRLLRLKRVFDVMEGVLDRTGRNATVEIAIFTPRKLPRLEEAQ